MVILFLFLIYIYSLFIVPVLFAVTYLLRRYGRSVGFAIASAWCARIMVLLATNLLFFTGLFLMGLIEGRVAGSGLIDWLVTIAYVVFAAIAFAAGFRWARIPQRGGKATHSN